MSSDRADIRRRNLRRFMDARGLKPKPWCERAGLSPNSLYNFLNGRSDSLSQPTLEALSAAENVHPSQLMGESVVPLAKHNRSITVIGSVQAGAWVEAIEWPLDERFTISVPFENEFYNGVYGLVVRGDSMNKDYPDGSIVFVTDIYEYKKRLVNGDHVICERVDSGGLVEATVKELVFDEKGASWLWPRSTNPEHQQPIEVSASGLMGEHLSGALTVRVHAVVVGALVKRPRR